MKRRVPIGQAVRAALDAGPHSARAVSRALGKSEAWAGVAARPTSSPSLATVADVAGVQGMDVVLLDRATGDVVAVVEPPTPAARPGTTATPDGAQGEGHATSTPTA